MTLHSMRENNSLGKVFYQQSLSLDYFCKLSQAKQQRWVVVSRGDESVLFSTASVLVLCLPQRTQFSSNRARYPRLSLAFLCNIFIILSSRIVLFLYALIILRRFDKRWRIHKARLLIKQVISISLSSFMVQELEWKGVVLS